LSEATIQGFIIAHAVLGSLGLLAGLVALIVKKGGLVHRRSGRLFYYSMLGAAASALIISVMPGHESVFLFVVGIFSSYFVLSGDRALRFKSKVPNSVDYIISIIMLITGIVMIALSPVLVGKINIVLTVFGAAGVFFAIGDFRFFRKLESFKKNWLKAHLGKMMGAYIASVTAFITVNQIIPGVYGWIAPGVIGSVFITVWSRKISAR
jgi:hypothetical protein